MSVLVSRQLRLALEERMTDQFNQLIAEAFLEFGISQSALMVNFAGDPALPQNFVRGDRSWESLQLHAEPDLPLLAFWTGEGQDQQTEHPRKFAGLVAAHWRFFLCVAGIRTEGLTDLREATESAMIDMLDDELPGFGYGGLFWHALAEQQFVDQDLNHVGWVQEVNFQAIFEVRA